MTTKKKADEAPVTDTEAPAPGEPRTLDMSEEEAHDLMERDPGLSDVARAEAHADSDVADPTPPPEAYGIEDSPVTMRDVAALNGIGTAPDASGRKTVGTEGLFISAGMASDLDQQGWTIDPATGNKVVREQ
jgi:hypothetical protein